MIGRQRLTATVLVVVAPALALIGGCSGGSASGGSGGAAGGRTPVGGSGRSDAGGAAGAAGSGAAAGAGGAVGGADAGVSALQTAELATGYNPNALTYTHDSDPDTGDQTPIGWGPGTLPTQGQVAAATALIRRMAALLPDSVRNSTNTGDAIPGTPAQPSVNVPNPLNGLLILNADPASLISGSNLAPAAGTALAAFRAAAMADSALPKDATNPGGLTAAQAADDAALGLYIATVSSDPSSAIGLASNIVLVAVQYGLNAQLQAY